ncbi:MAG: MBL fold metallo-hydrolase [Bacillota bacterium]|nr:MBL fold metallo-hydrolase [Bacillota bacterium]
MELKDKSTITFHEGTQSIGGTLVEISYKDSRVFFDAGGLYLPELENQPKNFSELFDHGLVVKLPGLYDPKLGKEIVDQDFYKNQGVFVSHVHLDHSNMINYINPKIKVYMSNDSKILLQALNYNNDFILPFEENQKDYKISTTRPLIGLDYNQEVSIGQIKVKLVKVDHDAYGACGLIISCPDKVYAYSGDIRLHGYNKNASLNFCKEAKACDYLITEGVSVSFNEVGSPLEDTTMTEEILANEFLKLVKESDGRIISFNYYPANIERLVNLKKILAPYRELVLDAHNSHILKELTGIESKYYLLDQTNYGLKPENEVKIDTLLSDPSFFWQLNKAALKYIKSMQPGSLYIHSNAWPLGPFDPAYDPFFKLFEENNIETRIISCSGHGYSLDLIKIIDQIRPKILCPIHSFQPQRLFNLYGERLLPEKGQVYI